MRGNEGGDEEVNGMGDVFRRKRRDRLSTNSTLVWGVCARNKKGTVISKKQTM
jgi:hypothetical protein